MKGCVHSGTEKLDNRGLRKRRLVPHFSFCSRDLDVYGAASEMASLAFGIQYKGIHFERENAIQATKWSTGAHVVLASPRRQIRSESTGARLFGTSFGPHRPSRRCCVSTCLARSTPLRQGAHWVNAIDVAARCMHAIQCSGQRGGRRARSARMPATPDSSGVRIRHRRICCPPRPA